MRWCLVLLILLCNLSAARIAVAQEPDSTDDMATAYCTFAADKEVSVRYRPATLAKNEKLPLGKPWAPGGSPMFLFTQTELTIANARIPIGAYSLYAIPGDKNWLLVVNRNVDPKLPYDSGQDLVRASMSVGSLGQPVSPLHIGFGGVGVNRCEMRIACGKTMAWLEIGSR